MIALKTAIHKALRDDGSLTADAAVGIRALLNQPAADPFGVYQGRWQGTPKFMNGIQRCSILTWEYIQAISTGTDSTDLQMREQVFRITGWSPVMDQLELIMRRSRFVMQGLRRVTMPSVDIELHKIAYEGAGPDLFDDAWQVYYRADHYRAFYREHVDIV